MRICSGVFPFSTYTTTSANQEIVKNLLDSVGASEAKILTFVPKIQPCLLSINNGAFINCDLLEIIPESANINSIRISVPNTTFQMQLEY